MKTKVSFKIVIPTKEEDKKIKKIMAEISKEEKEKKAWDYKKVKHSDGRSVKHLIPPKKKRKTA